VTSDLKAFLGALANLKTLLIAIKGQYVAPEMCTYRPCL